MNALAVALVALAGCGYALGARMQHAAVQDTIGDQGLRARSALRLIRNHRWLLGLVSMGGGALLHACALGIAPLSVVQPVGVLALPLTVLLNARRHGRTVIDVNRRMVLSVIAGTGAVGMFVVLAAESATATSVAPDDQQFATQLIAVVVLVLGALGALTRSRPRCIAFAAACAVAYGYVSLLMRAVAQQVMTLRFDDLNLVPLLGVVAAMVIGGWLLQHAYASGPPDVVVACLTVIDPLVAVGLGIGLLGEADNVGAGTAAGELLCAVVACAAVLALARYHPDTQDQPVASTPCRQ